ncbi:MAG: hypothetical protein V4694_03865 [Pseudomonadota bacterium]
MTNKSLKSFLTALTLLSSLMFAHAAFAQISKSQIQNSEQSVEDPDLKLSIEELRKKYPIEWFDSKFGEYYKCATDSEGEYDDPKLICRLTINKNYFKNKLRDGSKIKLFDPLRQLNESQIKSIIVHHSNKVYDDGYPDIRLDNILEILEIQTADTKNTNPLKTRIKDFLYSDVAVNSFKNLSCESLSKFDVNNSHYDSLALEYFRKIYFQTSGNADKLEYFRKIYFQPSMLDDDLKECLPPKQRSLIRKKLLEELKTKIRE